MTRGQEHGVVFVFCACGCTLGVVNRIACGLLILISFPGWGQTRKHVLFQLRDFPSQIYSIETHTNQQINLRWYGRPEILRQLQERSIPMISKDSTVIFQRGKVTCGPVDSTGTSFPIVGETTISTTTGKRAMPPEGTIMYMHGRFNGPTQVDSLMAPGLSDRERENYALMAQQTMDGMYLPPKRITIGDTVVRHTTISLPVTDKTIDIMITTTYQLVKVRKATADFDVVISFALKASGLPYPVTTSGQGRGKMTYDIVNSLLKNYSDERKLTIDVQFMEDVHYECVLQERMVQEFSMEKRLN